MTPHQEIISKTLKTAGRGYIIPSPRQSCELAEHFKQVCVICQALATLITATDHQINRVDYDPYDLTEEENTNNRE